MESAPRISHGKCTSHITWKVHVANIQRGVQGHKHHIVAALPYLKHHPFQKEVLMPVTLRIADTLGHTSGDTLRKVISVCGTPLCMT